MMGKLLVGSPMIEAVSSKDQSGIEKSFSSCRRAGAKASRVKY